MCNSIPPPAETNGSKLPFGSGQFPAWKLAIVRNARNPTIAISDLTIDRCLTVGGNDGVLCNNEDWFPSSGLS